MKKTARRGLVDDAGRLYVLRKQLAELVRERQTLDDRIARLEGQVEEAESEFDVAYDRIVAGGLDGGATAEGATEAEDFLTPGKLPHRVYECMKRAPSRIYTAADLTTDLDIDDVQHVRTALARLVGKGLVRRTGVKGEFTI